MTRTYYRSGDRCFSDCDRLLSEWVELKSLSTNQIEHYCNKKGETYEKETTV